MIDRIPFLSMPKAFRTLSKIFSAFSLALLPVFSMPGLSTFADSGAISAVSTDAAVSGTAASGVIIPAPRTAFSGASLSGSVSSGSLVQS